MRGYSLCPIAAGDDAAARRIAADRSAHLLELAWDGHRVLVSRMGDDLAIRSADYQPWHALFAALAVRLRRCRWSLWCSRVFWLGSTSAGSPRLRGSSANANLVSLGALREAHRLPTMVKSAAAPNAFERGT